MNFRELLHHFVGPETAAMFHALYENPDRQLLGFDLWVGEEAKTLEEVAASYNATSRKIESGEYEPFRFPPRAHSRPRDIDELIAELASHPTPERK